MPLRDACADAFVAAVDHFNSGSLKYSWPRYLPVRDISGFFRPLKDAILRRLAAKPILESYETMVVPSLLTYVPRCRFSDNKGEPITLSARTKAKYLSSAYQDRVAEPLSSLGIKTLDDNGFPEIWHGKFLTSQTTSVGSTRTGTRSWPKF